MHRIVRVLVLLLVALCTVTGADRAEAAPTRYTWVERTPSARLWHAAAYDAARSRTVLFGGSRDQALSGVTPDAFLDDTWEWTGSAWLRMTPATSPPARRQSAMAHGGSKVVLFGGFNGAVLGDTWTWNGTTWTQLAPATSPPARYDHAMVYDSARSRFVLYGGVSGNTLGDTWEFDGTTWTQMSPATSPPTSSGHAMAFDAAAGRTVLHGGGNLTESIPDVWQFDGSTWTQIVVDPVPTASGPMAFDASRGRVVLYHETSGTFPEVWEWTGAAWLMITPPSAPVARTDGVLVYDAARARVVLMGGSTVGPVDVWEWNGSVWVPRTPPVGSGHAMAFDALRSEIVVFGGVTEGIAERFDDTWTWDGASWTLRAPAHKPPARDHAAMAYSAATGTVVLFGGTGADSAWLDDTWEWDGADWIEKHPSITPGTRAGAAMAFDERRGRVVLFGGVLDAINTYGTWVWDGSNWSDVSGGTAPAGRQEHAMAYDTARGEVVLFGGHDQTFQPRADTWAWDGSAWRERNTPLSPGPRTFLSAAYDVQRQAMVMFGGYTGPSVLTVSGTVSTPGYMADTWEWTGASWSERTPDAAPGARFGQKLAYDTVRNRVVLFGGTDAELGAVADVWELVADPQLTVEATVDRSEVGPGETLRYTATVRNETDEVFVLDTLLTAHIPAGTSSASFQQCSGGPDSICAHPDSPVPIPGTGLVHEVVWGLGTLAAHEEQSFTFSVTVAPDTPEGTEVVNHFHATAVVDDIARPLITAQSETVRSTVQTTAPAAAASGGGRSADLAEPGGGCGYDTDIGFGPGGVGRRKTYGERDPVSGTVHGLELSDEMHQANCAVFVTAGV